MLLIDDPLYYPVQIKWFNSQISNIASDVWIDKWGKRKQIEAIAIKSSNYYYESELKELRGYLNDTGLKRLNNSISAFKRRQETRLKPVQLTLSPEAQNKLTKLRALTGETQSEYIENLIKKKKL